MNFIKIRNYPKYINQASCWFHQKWSIPQEVYLESMHECIQKKTCVPQWYLVMEAEKIIAGLGVIDNDFHNRKDLTPNICAVYVEENYRNQGIANKMLENVCEDMKSLGIKMIYLVTDHTSFYEKCGFEYLEDVKNEGEENYSRLYQRSL